MLFLGSVPASDAEPASSRVLVVTVDGPIMQLRVLSTLVEVSAEKNSTLVFPFPVELLRMVESLGRTARPETPAPAPEATAPGPPPGGTT